MQIYKMGNCSNAAADLNRELATKLDNIDMKDIQEIANLALEGWKIYEKLNSDNRNKLKKLTAEHFRNEEALKKPPQLVRQNAKL
jgi:plasmid maintenance system killer protein